MQTYHTIPPKTLTLITTYKCSAACNNCCFECNPNRDEMLPLAVAISHIDSAVSTYKDLQVVVLTGGECFLNMTYLLSLIKHIHSHNLTCRVVTNGFWAKSKEIAVKLLSECKKSGLDEISDEQIESAAVAVVVCILYAAVLAVSYVGAAYTALAAVNVGVGISVVYETAVTAKGKDQKPEKETDKDKETEKDKNKQKGDKLKISQNFDVYMLASKDEEEIAFGNDEFARIIDDAMEAFKELYIKDAKAIDLNLLKQTINLNLSKQNSISENITILKR